MKPYRTKASALLAAIALGLSITAQAQTQLVVAQSAEPVGLDATRNSLQASLNVALNIQETLFTPLEDGGVAPGLAESWKFSDDTTLRVKLKPNLTFHNGEPIDAASVKYSFERLVNPELKSPHAGRMEQITAVKVIDPLTVEFKTKAPFAPILHLMSYYLTIVPQKATAATDPDAFNRKPLGAGPYMVESWQKGGDVVLKAFDKYWAGKPAYDRVIIRAIPEESARVAAFVTGEVDIVEGMSVESQRAIEKSGKGVLTDSMGVMPYVGLNTNKPPFNDQRVRQAVNFGVDRATIKKVLFNDRGLLTPGPISPRTFGADRSLKAYTYDVTKAKQLLADAGFPNGFDTTLSYPTNMTQIQEQAQAIAADLAKIGVRAKLQPLDRAIMFQKYKNREQDMYIYWWDDAPEPDRYMYSLFNSKSRDYYYKNAETDALLEKGRSTLDRGQREKIYNQIDRKLYQEAPWVFLYVIPETYAVSNKVSFTGRRDGIMYLRYAKPKT